MSTMAPVAPGATSPLTRSVNGELRLTYPTRGYAVTRNPFAIWSVLPTVTLAFAALAIAVTVMSDQLMILTALGAFLIVTAGVLLVPAVALKGSLNLTHDGLTFERGKDHFTAGWNEITGLVYRRDAGLCITVRGQDQTQPNWKLPGGFRAANGTAQIPLRFFGDRQFSIVYDVRERLREGTWRPALEQAERASRSTLRNQLVYAGAMAIGGLAVFASYLTVTH
jgi:hypothetical protein